MNLKRFYRILYTFDCMFISFLRGDIFNCIFERIVYENLHILFNIVAIMKKIMRIMHLVRAELGIRVQALLKAIFY